MEGRVFLDFRWAVLKPLSTGSHGVCFGKMDNITAYFEHRIPRKQKEKDNLGPE